MKDLNAFEVLLDVREFKRWTLQMKKQSFSAKTLRKLTIHTQISSTLLTNLLLAFLVDYDCYKIVGSVLNLEKQSPQ